MRLCVLTLFFFVGTVRTYEKDEGIVRGWPPPSGYTHTSPLGTNKQPPCWCHTSPTLRPFIHICVGSNRKFPAWWSKIFFSFSLIGRRHDHTYTCAVFFTPYTKAAVSLEFGHHIQRGFQLRFFRLHRNEFEACTQSFEFSFFRKNRN